MEKRESVLDEVLSSNRSPFVRAIDEATMGEDVEETRGVMLKALNETFGHEWERQAFYWCMTHKRLIPESYKVSWFGHAHTYGDIYLTPDGKIKTVEGEMSASEFEVPIICKIEPEIEWVTPSDADARHRPTVRFIGQPDDPKHEKDGILLGLAMGLHQSFFICESGRWWIDCEMDAAQRENWK